MITLAERVCKEGGKNIPLSLVARVVKRVRWTWAVWTQQLMENCWAYCDERIKLLGTSILKSIVKDELRSCRRRETSIFGVSKETVAAP